MNTKTFLFIALTFFALNSFSQKANPVWMYLSNGQHITDIAEDSVNIWVGTTGGLVSINKQTEQKTYYNKVISDMPFTRVSTIFVDHNKSLWVADFEGGLAKFDGQIWQNFVLPMLDTLHPNRCQITDMAEDSKGNMWFTTHQAGVVQLSGSSFTVYTEYIEEGGSYSNSFYYNTNAITTDSLDNVWMGVLMGIATFHNDSTWSDLGNLNTYNGIPAGNISVLDKDGTGKIWAGSHQTGVVLPSIGYGEVSWHDANGWHFLPDTGYILSEVNDITFDPSGNVYIATGRSGVVKWDGNALTLLTLNNSNIDTTYTTSVHYDIDGNLWIGTIKGLYKMTGSVVSAIKVSNSNLPSNNTMVVFQKKDGTIYMQNNYTVIDGVPEKRSRIFKIKNGDTLEFQNPFHDNLNLKYEDSVGNIWGVSLYPPALVKINDTNLTWIGADTSMVPYAQQFFDLTWDRMYHQFWLGSQNGLFKYKNGQWSHEGYFMNSNSSMITAVYADSTGCVWVGSVGAGVACYKNNQWISQNYSWTMFNAYITKIIEDRNHNIWFMDGFGTKLGRYDGSSWTIFNPQNSPLSPKELFSIAFDQNNNLFVAQGFSGIKIWNTQSWDSLTIDNSKIDALVKNLFFDKNNNLYMLGNGITIYNPLGIVLSSNSHAISTTLKTSTSIYPNPAMDMVNIDIEKGSGEVDVYIFDIQGKLVENRHFTIHNSTPIKIKTDKLNSGIYLLSVINNSKAENYKLIISR